MEEKKPYIIEKAGSIWRGVAVVEPENDIFDEPHLIEGGEKPKINIKGYGDWDVSFPNSRSGLKVTCHPANEEKRFVYGVSSRSYTEVDEMIRANKYIGSLVPTAEEKLLKLVPK